MFLILWGFSMGQLWRFLILNFSTFLKWHSSLHKILLKRHAFLLCLTNIRLQNYTRMEKRAIVFVSAHRKIDDTASLKVLVLSIISIHHYLSMSDAHLWMDFFLDFVSYFLFHISINRRSTRTSWFTRFVYMHYTRMKTW